MLNQIDTETATARVPNGPDSESDRLVPCSLLQRRPDVNLHVAGDGPWESSGHLVWAGRAGREASPRRTGQVPRAQALPAQLGAVWVVQAAGGRGFQRAEQC